MGASLFTLCIHHLKQVTEGKESPFRLDIVSNACFKIRVYLKT